MTYTPLESKRGKLVSGQCPGCGSHQFIVARLSTWQGQDWPEGVIINTTFVRHAQMIEGTLNPQIGYCLGCHTQFSKA